MTLGERIKHMRRKLDYTQDQLSELADISQVQISRYEQDLSMPTSEVVVNLARALGVSTDWLLGLTEVTGMDSLTEIERQALEVFRAKTPDRQPVILEVMRLFQ